MNRKRIAIWLAVTALLGAVLSACEKQPAEESSSVASAEETASVPASSEETQPVSETEPVYTVDPALYVKELKIASVVPDIVDPQRIMNNASDMCFKMVYNQLVSWDFEERKLEPELALRWEVSEDGLEYTFHLRDDVTFTNGQPFESDDVVYTFKERTAAVRNEGGNYQFGDLTNILADVVAVDKTTVKIVLTEPNADIPLRLYMTPYSIFNREACEADPKEGYRTGTGGWTLDEFVPAEKAVFTKYTGSWIWKVNGHIPTEKVSFEKYTEDSAKAAALAAQAVCAVPGLSEEAVAVLPENKFTTVRFAEETLDYFFVNCKSDLFAEDVNLRKAVAYALDREAVNEIVYGGRGTMTGTFWGLHQFGYDETRKEGLVRDLAKAREYLAASAHPDGDFTIRLWIHNKWGEASESIKRSLEETLGCTVELIELDTSTTSAVIRRWMEEGAPYDLAFYNISVNPTGNRFAYVTNLKSTTNRAYYFSAEMEALFAESLKTTDDAVRTEICRRIQSLLLEEMPYIPVLYEPGSITFDSRVSGIGISPDNKFDFSLIRMTKE